MGDGFQIFDILLFAAVAGFLGLRLWQVLGRRTGQEQRRDPFWNRPTGAPPPPPGTTSKVVRLMPRAPVIEGAPAPVTPAVSGLAALKAADPSFDEQHFMAGARTAFQIIVNSFAAGDKAALRPLLSDDVFGSFAQAIDTHHAARERVETNLIALKSADAVDATIEGNTGIVTVKFVSDQTNVVRGEDGSVRDGDPDHVVEKTDLWTFARPLGAQDPNWTLVATHSA